MATKKKMLQAAAGQAGGAGGAALDITDVFSTYLYEGNGGTQSIVNGIALGGDTGGAISLQAQADGLEIPQSSDFNFGTGDFTCEAWIYLEGTNSTYRTMLGFDTTGGLLFEVHTMKLDFGVRGTASNYSTSTLTADQWNHVAIVRSSGTAYWFINGTLDKTDASTYSSTDFSNATAALIGDYQKNTTNFDGSISNLRVSNVARYTSSFTPSTTPLTSDSSTVLLIGQNPDPFVDNSSSSHSASAYGSPAKSGVGPFTATDSGEGGLVWIKGRGATANGLEDHVLTDTERGVSRYLRTSSNTSEDFYNGFGLTAFNGNGFSVTGNDDVAWLVNSNDNNYASWTFRKAPKFFDVVTWTGDGTDARQISHSLNNAPGCIIVKNTSSSNTEWMVYHRSLSDDLPNHSLNLVLNQTYQQMSWKAFGEHSTQTSSVFTLGTSSPNEFFVNQSGQTYVAYVFAHNDGDGGFGPDGDQDIIKCGSYTGTGGSFAQEITLGFEPQWVLIKRTDSTSDWWLDDSMRGDKLLQPNDSQGDIGADFVQPTATGFKPGYPNQSGQEYIYMAIRRGPLAQPESATEVFAIDQENSSEPYYTSGFPVDFALTKNTNSTQAWRAYSRLTQTRELRTDTNGVEGGEAKVMFDYMDGHYSGSEGSTVYSWMWKRAPGFFDVVAYSGNSTAGRTVSHNLGVAPEMIWVKNRDNANDWNVWHSALSATQSLRLNLTNAVENNSWFTALPTDQSFFTNSYQGINASGNNYVAYLFATVPGVSKVGSYTGNGSSQTIDCGFTSGARFVLIKNTEQGRGWVTIDTARGLTSGDDKVLYLNATNAQSDLDFIDPNSSGFTLSTSNDQVNASGRKYIFYAIA